MRPIAAVAAVHDRPSPASRDAVVPAVLAAVVRAEWGRLTSLLLGRFRRLDLVEDALADAVEAAARRWPRDGAPDNPAAWLHTTARRRVLDRLRAEAMAQRRMPLLVVDALTRQETPVRADPGDLVSDDLLRLVLMCTHPALDPAAASALALRLVLGVSTADIARLFFVPEPTMAARITRAKKKIVAAGIPFSMPSAGDLPDRVAGVARTAYLAFTAGYAPGSGPDVVRTELAGEAVRLVRVVHASCPDQPVLQALLALMVLQHSRRDARVDPVGAAVLLPDQDRTRWHRDEIAEGNALLGSLLGPGRKLDVLTGEYALQALIAAEHANASRAEETAWGRIAAHYAALEALTGSPVVRLARAVAVAEAQEPADGLALLDGLADDLAGSHRLPAVEAELAVRTGDLDRARQAYARAIALCGHAAETAYLRSRLTALGPPAWQDEPP